MADIAHHVMRRAIQATQDHYASTPSSDGGDGFEFKRLAPWGVALLWGTLLLYLAMVFAVDYTYGDVVATLTMVETPTATAFKTTTVADEEESIEVDAPLLSEDQKSEKQKLKVLEQNLFLVKQPPITRKMRTAVKHIVSVGGIFARFRGLGLFLFYHAIHGFIVNLFRVSSLRPFVSILATILLCRLHMLWTHVVISNPSEKRWFRRYPSRASVKPILLPTAIYAVAQQVAFYVPAGLGAMAADQLRNAQAYAPETARKVAAVEMVLVVLVGISIFLATIPAKVTLQRVQASLLPAEYESIVPFDRTFGGKVQPRIQGGSGAVSMLDAWKSFDRSARLRLIKLYLKIVGIQMFAAIAFAVTLVGELRLIMGDDFNKMIEKAQEQMKGKF